MTIIPVSINSYVTLLGSENMKYKSNFFFTTGFRYLWAVGLCVPNEIVIPVSANNYVTLLG